jgi:hypothetical protein
MGNLKMLMLGATVALGGVGTAFAEEEEAIATSGLTARDGARFSSRA